MSDALVVVSKVKAKLKEKDLRTSQDAIEKLSAEIETKLEDAATRAKAAGRKTVMAEDIV